MIGFLKGAGVTLGGMIFMGILLWLGRQVFEQFSWTGFLIYLGFLAVIGGGIIGTIKPYHHDG